MISFVAQCFNDCIQYFCFIFYINFEKEKISRVRVNLNTLAFDLLSNMQNIYINGSTFRFSYIKASLFGFNIVGSLNIFLFGILLKWFIMLLKKKHQHKRQPTVHQFHSFLLDTNLVCLVPMVKRLLLTLLRWVSHKTRVTFTESHYYHQPPITTLFIHVQ